MKPGSNYVELMTGFEGCVLHPYTDKAGHTTIGIGSTYYADGTPVKMTDPPITLDQAIALLMSDSTPVFNTINSVVTSAINQNMFTALSSFSYNEGTGAFKSSTLLKKININPLDPTIRNEFMKWVYIHDPVTHQLVVLQDLVDRRTQEADIYFTPVS